MSSSRPSTLRLPTLVGSGNKPPGRNVRTASGFGGRFDSCAILAVGTRCGRGFALFGREEPLPSLNAIRTTSTCTCAPVVFAGKKKTLLRRGDGARRRQSRKTFTSDGRAYDARYRFETLKTHLPDAG